jgi:hypothetical protein
MSLQDVQPTSLEAAVALAAEHALQRVASARAAVGAVIFGQEEVVEQTLVTLLSGGHGLLVGVPGLAKTKLVETLGTVLGLSAQRVQFTPDLPLHPGSDLRAAAYGRRDQPRQPTHAVRIIAGDAGATCDGCGHAA